MNHLLPYSLDDPVLAAATWSRLVEPADMAAATLVGCLGATGALRWLTEEALTSQAQIRPHFPLPEGGESPKARQAWHAAVERWRPRLAGLDIRRELEFLERLDGTFLWPGHPLWPEGLNELEQPPFCLWVRGDATVLQATAGYEALRSVALVGARASTRYGEGVASQMAHELTAAGVLVISGGAFGIDAAAHRGALAAGSTLSVSAGGVDRLYPPGNASLLAGVIESGALIAEVPPGCQPGRHRFLSRNRVIAALAHGTVVVEAAWRSGALSTATHARHLGRPLGAVPGPVTSMASVGCHRLLREGAVCITDADDVRELISPIGQVDAQAIHEENTETPVGLLDGLSSHCALVLDAMPAARRTSVTSLACACGLSESEVRGALGLLELAGRVQHVGEHWIRSRRSG